MNTKKPMNTNQKNFLTNIQNKLHTALLPQASPEHPGSFRDYTFQAAASQNQLIDDFKRELEALAGHVYVLDDIEDTAQQILQILERHQAKTIITWEDENLGQAGLKAILTKADITFTNSHISTADSERKADLANLNDVRVGLTGAWGGLADTGAIALFSGPGRGRLASLLPPVHIALLSKSKLYPALPAFLADHPAEITQNSNLVFIAGPSRTGDIELTLTMGVHGPGEVHIIIIP